MKIAFVSLMSGSKWGGSEALWHSIALHAIEKGDHVFVSVYDFGPPIHEKIQLLRQKGATVYFRKRFNNDAGFIEKVTRFVKKRQPGVNKDYQSIINFKPDFVFINQGDSFDLAIHHKPLYNLLQRQGIPYSLVCHSHTQYGALPSKEIYPGAVEIFRNARYVFFVSERQRNITERRLVCRLENGLFTWNPLNIQLPEYPLAWKENDNAQFAIVGAISANKGHDTLLEVFSLPQWKDRSWILNIYGTGEGEKYLSDLAVFYGIEKKIRFHGHISDMTKVWKLNQLLLIPSAGEGLPISLAEAMVCGRAAVVTDVGGNTELITENESGFIADAPTVSSFSGAMEIAWSKKNNWQQYGINAFKKINAVLEKNPQIKIYELLKKEK